MCHIDYSQEWRTSERYVFKSKVGRHISRQNKRHDRRKEDFTDLTPQQVFEIKKCKSKSSYPTEEDALLAGLYASNLVGACRAYKCDICGHYHLTTQIPSNQ